MNAAQPAQGVELMLYGMGTVLLFLVLLVWAMRLMSWIVGRYFPDPAVTVSGGSEHGAAVPGEAAVDPQLLAAIGAAVHAHRSRTDT